MLIFSFVAYRSIEIRVSGMKVFSKKHWYLSISWLGSLCSWSKYDIGWELKLTYWLWILLNHWIFKFKIEWVRIWIFWAFNYLYFNCIVCFSFLVTHVMNICLKIDYYLVSCWFMSLWICGSWSFVISALWALSSYSRAYL